MSVTLLPRPNRTLFQRASGLYGAGTLAAVRALQEDLGVPGTGVVDEATVRIINAKPASVSAEPRMVAASFGMPTATTYRSRRAAQPHE